ncbi:hypothetical protein SAMN04515695_6038 [Pseudovibrio sp. Tun.PSC04-5.I4]|nr:hypothetical protein SAMN04515695_6038 [Pseudovibrio sp. Tun.PSC04-5.I4]
MVTWHFDKASISYVACNPEHLREWDNGDKYIRHEKQNQHLW